MREYIIGLDLGQAQDYTALAVAERHADTGGNRYDIAWLQRFALGTPYPAIVAAVVALVGRLAAQPDAVVPTLVVDMTGVGRPVVDLFRQGSLAAALHDITITGGDTPTHEGASWRVPKRDLVSVVKVLLGGERLKVASALPEAAMLTRELLNFQVKITALAHDAYGAWREGTHDDLVLAVALAAWLGEYGREPVQGFAFGARVPSAYDDGNAIRPLSWSRPSGRGFPQ